jgi:hypothetical protein
MKVTVNTPKTIDLKTVRIYVKCSDRFSCIITTDDPYKSYGYDGYVPDVIPGDYGDYIDLNIDIETGMILNWPKNNPDEWAEFLTKCE